MTTVLLSLGALVYWLGGRIAAAGTGTNDPTSFACWRPERCADPSATRWPKAAASVVTIEGVDDLPADLLDALDHELGDTVAAVDDERFLRISVQQDDLYLTAVRGVDQPGGVGQRQPVVQGVAAARQDETGVADRDGDRDTVGINSRPPPGGTTPCSRARRSRPASPACA